MLPLFAAGAGILTAGPAHAQRPGGAEADTAATSEADSLQLVFEREVFNYPQYERRNPFEPLTGDEVSGPRFEDMVLLGVVIQANPQESVAVLGARPPGATSEQPPTRTFRLRPGESIGNMRVIEVGPREVLLEVADFGVSETRRLALRRPPARPVSPPPLEAPADSAGPPAEAVPAPADSAAAAQGGQA